MSMTTDPPHGSPPLLSSQSGCFCRWAASRGGVTTKVYSFTHRGSQTERLTTGRLINQSKEFKKQVRFQGNVTVFLTWNHKLMDVFEPFCAD